VAEELASKLNFFNELDPITRLLSSPNEMVCLEDKFIPSLVKLDDCLAFLSEHASCSDGTHC
jgi:hypothetical protein